MQKNPKEVTTQDAQQASLETVSTVTGVVTAGDQSLPDLYTALAEIEGKIADHVIIVEGAKSHLGDVVSALDGLKTQRRDLHAAIRAKKARAKPAAAPASNTDPDMPAHLRRTP